MTSGRRDCDYEIRGPREDEVEECARVHVQIWREAYAGIMPDDVLAAQDPTTRIPMYAKVARGEIPHGQLFLVAVHRPSGRVVGLVSSGPGRDDEPPVPLELRAINVLAGHHGTGVAQQLLDAAIGDRAAYLWVADGNERAQAFYRRNGFALDGARKRDDDLKVDELRMTRRDGVNRPVSGPLVE